ncbi:DinB family protein [Calycomorphotria hydatis]|uniref:DinB superfamily protein n=1 Tax=Calycomorphotria hydatis TaxID=2528027 RepID=A0A517TEX2_9PLAN|nr:DinB family protein [Calycomorphotria hydatis]QDT66924.1 DinB superfamily protein [Calycomorphotria hydatis]
MNNNSDRELRDWLIWNLKEGQAHIGFEATFGDVAADFQNQRVEGIEHSLWELLEHLRICQWDILRFSITAEHVSPSFPEGYWPDSSIPAEAEVWEVSYNAFLADRAAMCELIQNEEHDLFTPFPWGEGQNLLREALLLADHNAYHIGQAVMVRKALKCWK